MLAFRKKYLLVLSIILNLQNQGHAQETVYWQTLISKDSLLSDHYTDTLDKIIIGTWNMSKATRNNCSVGIVIINEVPFNPNSDEINKALKELEVIKSKAIKLGILENLIFLDIREPSSVLGPEKFITIRVNMIHKLIEAKS